MARDVSDEAQREFLDSLKRGELTPDAVEALSIATPKNGDRFNLDTPEQRDIQAYFDGLTQRLLGNEFAQEYLLAGKPVPQFRFLIADKGASDYSINAAIITEANPPLVFFTSELIRRCAALPNGEDILAGVLAHELTHYFVGQATDREANSKLEEGTADALPTFLLHYGGFQSNGLLDFFKKITKSGEFGKLFSYLDVHPSAPLRERVIDDSQGMLAQHLRQTEVGFKGLPQRSPSPIPDRLMGVVNNTEYYDVIERDFESARISSKDYWPTKQFPEKTGKTREERGLNNEENKEKVGLILANWDRWLAKSDPILGTLGVEQRKNKLRSIIRDSFSDEHCEAVFDYETIRPLLEKSTVDGVMGDWGWKHAIAKTGLPREGFVAELLDSYEAFIPLCDHPSSTPDIRHAAQSAQKLVETVGKYGWLKSIVPYQQPHSYQRYLAKDFPQLLDSAERPAWDQAVMLAQQENQQLGTSHIADALRIIGIEDPRLFRLPTALEAQATLHEHRLLNTRDGYDSGIVQSPDGAILGSGIRTYHKKYQEMINDAEWSHRGAPETVDLKLAQARRTITGFEDLRPTDFAPLYQAATQAARSFSNVEELNWLLAEYSKQLAYPVLLFGGKEHSHEYEPHAALVRRLEELAAQDSNTWVPLIQELFAKNIKTSSYDKNSEDSTTGLKKGLQNLASNDGLYYGTHEFVTGRYPHQDKYANEHVYMYLPEEIGIRVDHPYIQFVLRHTTGLGDPAYFTANQMLSALDRVVSFQVRTPEGVDLPAPEVIPEAFEVYKKATGVDGLSTSDAELGERLAWLRELRPSVMWADYRPIPEHEWASPFFVNMAKYEGYEYLTQHPDTPICASAFDEIFKACEAQIQISRNGGTDKSGVGTGKAYVEQLGKLLEQRFLINAEHDLHNSVRDPLELAKAYALYERAGYFQRHPEFRWENAEGAPSYDALIRHQIHLLTSSGNHALAQEFSETLLFGCNIQSPSLRKELIEAWASSIQGQIGIDQTPAFDSMNQHAESAGFYQHIQAIAERVCEKAPSGGLLAREMLDALANAVETQADLTDWLAIRGKKQSSKAALENARGTNGMLSEYGLDFVVSDEGQRVQTINLLTQPLTDAALEAYVDTLQRRQEAVLAEQRRSEFGGSKELAWLESFRRKPLDAIFAAGTHKTDFTDPEVRNEVKGKLRAAYENFWESSLGIRAYYMNLLAFPETRGITGAAKAKQFGELVNHVLEKVLPLNPDQPANSDFNLYSSLGRDLVVSYLKDASEAEQRLMLSALMVSAKSLGSVEERDERTIGKALGLVLQNMGPAGVKLAQAIHSFPDTPLAIREGMEGVKAEANLPSRDEMFKRIRKVVPANDEHHLSIGQIDHVAHLLGGGSYQYVVQAGLNRPLNGYDDVALTVLRDHVRTFAENEFKHFEDTIESFIEKRRTKGEQISERTVQALRQVLKQAENMAVIETDYNLGAHQAELMKERYEGLIIQSGDRRVLFDTVEWLDHASEVVQNGNGEDIRAYKVASIAPGTGFNKWVKDADSTEVSRLVGALQCAEDMMMYSATHFDHDRHGGNFHVYELDRDTIVGKHHLRKGDLVVTGYDFGAVNLEPPTPEEKREFGEVVGIALSKVKTGAPIRESLIEALSDAIASKSHESAVGGDYLSAVLRGLLARGDFLRYADSSTLTQAAVAAISHGAIDSEVLKGAAETVGAGQSMGGFAGQVMGGMARGVSGILRGKTQSPANDNTVSVVNAPDELRVNRNPLLGIILRNLAVNQVG